MRSRELTYRSKRTKEGVKLDGVKADGCLIARRKCSQIRMRRARDAITHQGLQVTNRD
jgi:hypothetical protein